MSCVAHARTVMSFWNNLHKFAHSLLKFAHILLKFAHTLLKFAHILHKFANNLQIVMYLMAFPLNYFMPNFHKYSNFTSKHIVSVKVGFAIDLSCFISTSANMGE